MKNGSRTTIIYEKNRSQSKIKFCNQMAKPGLTKESNAVCGVRLEKNRSLRVAAARSND